MYINISMLCLFLSNHYGQSSLTTMHAANPPDFLTLRDLTWRDLTWRDLTWRECQPRPGLDLEVNN